MDKPLRTRQTLLVSLSKLLAPADDLDWGAVYTEELPRVYNFFRYRIGDDATAEDLTSATFERAWRARHRYRQDRGATAAWLFAIARRVAIDHFRARPPEVPLDAAGDVIDEARGPEQIVSQSADVTRLLRLLASHPLRDQELIALKYGAGLNNRQIAQVVGLSESNVGTILHRAVSKLRTEWEQEELR